MFDIGVVGTGYVGLVTGACLADLGNHVTCVDTDIKKIEELKAGRLSIYEPGLAELVGNGLESRRLHFATTLPIGAGFDLIFIAVGTPSLSDGALDTSAIESVLASILSKLTDNTIIVIKSTVPPGTTDHLQQKLVLDAGRRNPVIYNPEFLKEGDAVRDFQRPDRIIIGSRAEAATEVMKRLYETFILNGHRLLVMSPRGAELSKLAANAMLATRVSFMNSLAGLCEATGGDIGEVREGIGTDSRIGMAFLHAGPGYGGSCFGKDLRGLQAVARVHQRELSILSATEEINQAQKEWAGNKLASCFGDYSNFDSKAVAIWGLAFKPHTGDIREAPTLALIDRLWQTISRLVSLRVYDPVAIDNVRQEYGNRLIYCQSALEAATGADALVVMTEWPEFRQPDFAKLAKVMRGQVIIDGRRMWHPEEVIRHGFTYHSVGRPVARPK